MHGLWGIVEIKEFLEGLWLESSLRAVLMSMPKHADDVFEHLRKTRLFNKFFGVANGLFKVDFQVTFAYSFT